MIERPSGLGAAPTPAFEEQRERWKAASAKGRPRTGPGSGAVDRTISDVPLKAVYGPQDVAELDLAAILHGRVSIPIRAGSIPTAIATGSGRCASSPASATRRKPTSAITFLLEHGQHGLSVAFDMPTLMGYDSDAPQARGEVGKCGVAIDSLADMEVLFDGIDMGDITTSMTINGPACIALAQYIAAAEKKGIPRAQARRNDSGRYPQRVHRAEGMDLSAAPAHADHRRHDRVLHARDAEVEYDLDLRATTFAKPVRPRRRSSPLRSPTALRTSKPCMAAGMDVDSFAPRLSFFFNSHIDFFEEIAKFRAARRIYARHMREKYGAKDPRSWQLRFHTQTAGCSATAQQPENNIVRVAFEAMAAVLGGTQSLHTNSMDEVLALPTEKSVEIALRTQQVLAYETNVTNVVDPLGGSYFVEALTDEMERQAESYFAQIAEYGGVIEAIEAGFFQREIADASYRYQRSIETQDRIIVGVNAFVKDDEPAKISTCSRSPKRRSASKPASVQDVRAQSRRRGCRNARSSGCRRPAAIRRTT